MPRDNVTRLETSTQLHTVVVDKYFETLLAVNMKVEHSVKSVNNCTAFDYKYTLWTIRGHIAVPYVSYAARWRAQLM